MIRITRDANGTMKSEIIQKSSSNKHVPSKKRKADESSKDLKRQCREHKNKKDLSHEIVDEKEVSSIKYKPEEFSKDWKRQCRDHINKKDLSHEIVDEKEVSSKKRKVEESFKDLRRQYRDRKNKNDMRRKIVDEKQVSSIKYKPEESSKDLKRQCRDHINKKVLSHEIEDEKKVLSKKFNAEESSKDLKRECRHHKNKKDMRDEIVDEGCSNKKSTAVVGVFKSEPRPMKCKKRKLIRITRDANGTMKSEIISRSSSNKHVSSKKLKADESFKDLKSQYRDHKNKKDLSHEIVDEGCSNKKSTAVVGVFKSEPRPMKYKNAYDMYKKDPPIEKCPIQSLKQWNSVFGWQHVVYEREFNEIEKKYEKKMNKFLSSLSVEDLGLYLKLKILEKRAKNNLKKRKEGLAK